MDYDYDMEDDPKYKAPLPWIGMYVAAASLLCFLAIAADAFLAFRGKKLWFPCKFFALNAAWLTLLAVAMKMPLDLSTPIPARCDQLAKLSSTALLGVVIANFMPSLGPMDNKALFTNIIALAIFVITVVVNVCIELGTTLIPHVLMPEHILVIASVLFLLIMLICSALNVPTTKKYLEIKYSDLHRVIASEDLEQVIETQLMTTEMLKGYVRKYWIVAETGSPQFAIARSITCSSSGAICFLIILCLVRALVRFDFLKYEYSLNVGLPEGFVPDEGSDYKWSTFFILIIQNAVVLVGTVGPAVRWFATVKFKCCPKKSIRTYITELKPESYWIEQLVEWKESPSLLQIQSKKCRKLVQGTNNVFLSLCIKFQIMVVLASKLIILISILLLSPFLLCHQYFYKKLKKLLQKSGDSTNHTSSESTCNTNLDPRLYVLSLDGEDKLPESTLKSISDAVDHLIQNGKRKQPKNLKELLQNSTRSKMVAAEFNSKELALLINSQEPACCWALSVVNLTAIAVAILKTKSKMVEQLICSVSEGLSYVRLVEEIMDIQGSLTSARNAANKVWVGVEFHHKWLDQDLHTIALEGTSPREILERLANNFENMVNEFKSNRNGGLGDSEVIAANSMFRITKTILNGYEGNVEQTEEELFQKLYRMVGRMLGACLTKLPNVIIKKCDSSAIEKRLENVSLAVQLLGETEEILKILQQHEFSLSEC